jgi:hypothetical protein
MKNWSEESFGGTFSGACPWEKIWRQLAAFMPNLGIELAVYYF